METQKKRLTLGIILLVLALSFVNSLEVGGGMGIQINVIEKGGVVPENNSSNDEFNQEDSDDEEDNKNLDDGFVYDELSAGSNEEEISSEAEMISAAKLDSVKNNERGLKILLSINFILLAVLLFFIANPKMKFINKK